VFEGLLQPTHLMLILAIAIVVFGPGKLPQLGKELGKGMREFRQAVGEISAPLDEVKGTVDEVKGTVAEVKDAATISANPSQPGQTPRSATK
jgi:sec-independent protein translocase protein TatA